MIIWFGTGLASKVAMATLSVVVVALLTSYKGAMSVDPDQINLMRTLGASKQHIFRKLVVPASLTDIFAGLKLTVGFALIGAIIGEFMSSSEGLGHAIFKAGSRYIIPKVFAALVATIALALVLAFIVGKIERLLSPGATICSEPDQSRRGKRHAAAPDGRQGRQPQIRPVRQRLRSPGPARRGVRGRGGDQLQCRRDHVARQEADRRRPQAAVRQSGDRSDPGDRRQARRHADGAGPRHGARGLGFTALWPGIGMFPDWVRREFGIQNRVVRVENGVIHWSDRLKLPVRPMIGVAGVAPVHGAVLTIDNGVHGGNLDVQEVTPGNSISFAVHHEGAHLFLGDCHAIQGDLEANGVGAIEIAARLTVSVEAAPRPARMVWPRIETPDHIGTLDARGRSDAARIAFEQMIHWLEDDYGIPAPGLHAARADRRGALHANGQPQVHLHLQGGKRHLG